MYILFRSDTISTQLISCEINISQRLPVNSPIFLPSPFNIALASRQPFLTPTQQPLVMGDVTAIGGS